MHMLLIVIFSLFFFFHPIVIHAEAQQAVTPGAEVVDKKTGKKVGKRFGLGAAGLCQRGQRPAAHRKPG
jgi:hypothetical protein